MKIKTFKPENYRGCQIYFRNFSTHFEYFVVIKNEIYTAHITITPTVINILLYWARLMPTKYSDFQEGKILIILRRMAQTTVDTIIDKEKVEKLKKMS